uniref:Uncharacterized protein n=1 Tax=Rhizophora mucronata TaxID=61149 RepID=A0A2P2LQG2_RHIMU
MTVGKTSEQGLQKPIKTFHNITYSIFHVIIVGIINNTISTITITRNFSKTHIACFSHMILKSIYRHTKE